MQQVVNAGMRDLLAWLIKAVVIRRFLVLANQWRFLSEWQM
jgi:hypothetical protein